ncbi:hypothetical protein AAHE18_03G215900 [Arachis hypogaea]
MKIQYTFHCFLYLRVQTLLWCQSLEEEAPRPTPEELEPCPRPNKGRRVSTTATRFQSQLGDVFHAE